ncbi:MAG: hypothetical protein M3Y56_13330, partial [Armatimonadota bacterium]|nr:hypothetical protein [Armatimonadota bacterium]
MANPQTSLVPTPSDSHLPTRGQGPGSPEAYQRSPTLMAGSTPGGGGAVRVWSPSRRLLWIGTISSALGGIALLALMFWTHVFGFIYSDVILFGSVLFCIRALLRPCYITTDESGIAITTPRGSRCFRWSDIERCDINTVATNRPHG